jgi:hypothetical protein
VNEPTPPTIPDSPEPGSDADNEVLETALEPDPGSKPDDSTGADEGAVEGDLRWVLHEPHNPFSPAMVAEVVEAAPEPEPEPKAASKKTAAKKRT